MTEDTFIATLAIVAIVIVVSTLLSGAIDKLRIPHAAVFLVIGALLGPHAWGLLDAPLDSPLLRVVATLSLALVLFTDAVGLDLGEVKRHWGLALRVLGPGTLLSAALYAVAAAWLLGLELPEAAVVGAALASTDPVLLRGLLRRKDVPTSARLALRLESGLNDVVLLPIVLAAVPLLDGGAAPGWGRMTLNIVVLGPVAGIAIGFVAVSMLEVIRKRTGIRRDYESLYSIGVAFSAFAAAEALHGSGFLAGFAAGITIVALDVELCDCFLEYGETTSEMALLFAFVLFGTSSIWTAVAQIDTQTLVFAGLVLLARPAIYLLSLLGSGMPWRARVLVAWFGPRGLSTLLLVMLPVFTGAAAGPRLFALCSIVVLGSIVLHGISFMLFRVSDPTLPSAAPEEIPTPVSTPTARADEPIRITFDELGALLEAGEPVILADVRTARSAREDENQAEGAIRLDPTDAVADARRLDLPKDALIVLYCA